jgi:single stranded DNA-binding protein (ssb)
MNSISISGNIGKDCELRQLPNGDSVAQFSVADSQGKDKPTIWWRASLFGKRADSLAPYLLKGQQVTVIGQVTEREYTDKDGAQKKAMEIRVTDVALQGGKREEAPAPQRQAPAQPSRPAQRPAARPAPAASAGFDDGFVDDDIPF